MNNNESNIPQAVPVKRHRWSPSLVWLLPLLAALVAGGLLVNALIQRGPTITVSFKNAAGLEAGKTRVKYKEVDIGEVKTVEVSKDRQSIIATIELNKSASDYIVADSRFWVVRPRISGGSISGLGTVVTGAYIAMDVGKSKQQQKAFIGLEEAPVIESGVPGKRFILHADSLGSLNTGAPVYFRRVPVGQVLSYDLDTSGTGVNVTVFVNEPYDQFVTNNTRFWHASGVDLSVNANGIKISTESLAAIALGGIAFETPIESGNTKVHRASNDHEFMLSHNRDLAMQNRDYGTLSYRLRFKQSIRGLTIGAPVDFRGIVVGEVKSIGLEYVKAEHDFDMLVDIAVYPGRIAALSKDDKATIKQIYETNLISHGMRAQMRTGNLLTGQAYVALDFFPNLKRVTTKRHNGVMELPTVPGDLEELQTILQRLLRRLNQVPVDKIGNNLNQSLVALQQTLANTSELSANLNQTALPQMLKTLQTLQSMLETTQKTMQANSPLQADIRSAAQEVSEAARSIKSLTEYLGRHPEALLRGKGSKE